MLPPTQLWNSSNIKYFHSNIKQIVFQRKMQIINNKLKEKKTHKYAKLFSRRTAKYRASILHIKSKYRAYIFNHWNGIVCRTENTMLTVGMELFEEQTINTTHTYLTIGIPTSQSNGIV